MKTIINQIRWWFAILLIVSLCSNAKAQEFPYSKTFNNTQGGAGFAPVGIAVDASSNIYIADPGNNRVRKISTAGNVLLTIGGTLGTGVGLFNHPIAVAVDASGNIYVVDQLNNLVQKFSSAGTFITQWGGLYSPSGIAIDQSGLVYVADSGNDRIAKYNGTTGMLINSYGSTGSGNFQFRQPSGIAVDASGNMYVADQNNHRVMKYNSAFTTVTEIGSGQGNTDGKFYAPYSIAIDGGDVFVSDGGNDRIQQFKTNGIFLAKWGSFGTSGDYKFNYPGGLAVIPQKAVLVADRGNYRVQVYTKGFTFTPVYGPYGTQVTILGSGFSGVSSVSFYGGATATSITVIDANHIMVTVPVGAQTGPITVVLNELPMTSTGIFTVTGNCGVCPSQSYELSQTWGTSEDWRSIATDGHSAVYAIRNAYLGAKVAKFDLNGNFITEWEGNAQGGTFASPLHVTTDKEGNVYVGYSYANNYDAGIRKFNSNGDVVGSSILVPNSSFNLKGLTVDLSGNIYACNAQNIFKYNSLGNLQATWSNAYSGDIARLAVDVNGNVYFTTNTTHKVVKLNASGTVISNWNAETTQAFDNPMDLDIDGCNNVIVCTNQGVKKFTNAGVLLTTVDNTRRSYVAIDGQSNIYTATADIKKMSLSSISNAVISSFTPTSGPAGTVVTITGSNFYSVTGISFNGVSAPTFTVNSATQITVTVPVGAETGKISVLLCGQETQSTDIYTVECPLGNSNYEHVREIYFNFGGDFYIASDAYGNLYRINGSQILYKYNIRGTILWSFDLRSIVPNIAAECLAVDAAGDIYIGNDNNSVIQIEANGNYKWTYSHPSLLSPEAIAVDYTGGYLYVADFTNHVKVFNLGGSFARTITAGPSPYGFDNGFGIAVNSVGEVYVTDDYYSGSSNVYRFSRLGAQLTTWNVGSYYISQTGRVKVDPYDNVYVSGDFPGKIVKLSPSGTYIGETQGSYWCYDFTVGPSCYIYDAPAGNVFAPSISGLRTSQQPEDMVSISGDRSALQVYPNPTYGNVTIIAAYDHYNMVLYDAQGMEVWQGQSNTREFRLNDLSLKPGVYILKIISGSETQQTKLIIKN